MLVPKILRALPTSTPTRAWKAKVSAAAEAMLLSLIPAVCDRGAKVEVTRQPAGASLWVRDTGLLLDLSWDTDVAMMPLLGYRRVEARASTPLRLTLISDLRTAGGQLAFVNHVRDVAGLKPLAVLPDAATWREVSPGQFSTGAHAVTRRSSLALAA